jgi:putative ABC transport system ATP-binding protein
MNEALRAEGLIRAFADRRVVDGASLLLREAESVALLGPSGCGKTTLLQMLGLLDRPQGGRVLLGGLDAWSLDPAGRARLRLRDIGFVFQQHNLLGHLSARENVALPAWQLGGRRRHALAQADAWLARFGLSAVAGRRAADLSGGEAQRVALARALINRPRLVLLDEPTGSLDSSSAQAVLAALGEVRVEGAALLLVTHDPAVAATASRQVAMRDGRILKGGA